MNNSLIYNNFEYLYKPSSLLRRFRMGFLDKTRFYGCRIHGGRKLNIRLSEGVGKGVFLHEVYDLPVSEAILRLIESNDIFGDIGANVGYTALLASTKLNHSHPIAGLKVD